MQPNGPIDTPSRRRFSGLISAWILGLVVLIPTLAGCAIFEDEDGTFRVRSDQLRVILDNRTSDQIYFNVFGRELSTLIDWIPHLDDDQSVAAGRTRTVPYAEIMMEDGEIEVILYWWRAEARNGERVPGTIESTIVEL